MLPTALALGQGLAARTPLNRLLPVHQLRDGAPSRIVAIGALDSAARVPLAGRTLTPRPAAPGCRLDRLVIVE
jgi:hypothetical protein